MADKTCFRCKQRKPLEDFTKHSKSPDGKYYCCRECKNWLSKNRYPEDPEKVRSRFQKWKEKNPNYHKEYEKLHPNKKKARNNRWTKKGLNAIAIQRRRARISELQWNFSQKDWEECLAFFDNSCCYCGTNLNITQDHLIPVISGGGYTKDNVLPACASCNSSKNNKNFYEWYHGQKFYSEDREAKIISYRDFQRSENLKVVADGL